MKLRHPPIRTIDVTWPGPPPIDLALGARPRGQSLPVRRQGPWFGLGTYASYAAAMSLAMVLEDVPERWDSPASRGLFLVALVVVSTFEALLYNVWLAIRNARFPRGRFAFAVPFGLGLVWPPAMVGLLFLAIETPTLEEHPGVIFAALVLLGPALMAEVSIRIERFVLARRSRRAKRIGTSD